MEAKVQQAVITNVTNQLIDSIWRQIGFVWNYSSNIQGLKAKAEKLKAERGSILRQVNEARVRCEEIEEIVEIWLKSADEAIEAAEIVLKEDNDKASKGCFIGCNPNWKTRYLLSRKAKKEALPAVDEVRGEKNFDRISHRVPLQKLELVKDYEAFESREQILNKIVEAMKNPDVKLIGVYGLGGVGKTTLAKQVTARVKEDGICKVVATASVTQKPDLNKIQQEIADWLGYTFDVESTAARGTRLRARLKQEEKALVVLDDIWEKINLEDIGIPNDHQGCRVFMTSRDLNVLLKMDVQGGFSFRLDVLQHGEAWQLFEKKVGDLTDPSLQPIAIEVARRCAGLPLLIVAVASALKGKELCEWKDALEELKRFDNDGIDAQVVKALQLTYNVLGAEEKSLFLLCGQLRPHIVNIFDLLRYSIGLGLFNQRTTAKVARNRLLKVVNDLKRSCLLLEDEDNVDLYVKMHDVVHNFAAFVGSRDHRIFSVTYGTVLEEWPAKEILEQLTAISLPDCKKIPQLPGVFECPNLHSFILYNVDSSLRIPDNFFISMKKLKLLDLSEVHLSPMPSSLQFLENLQTLCLDRCVLEDIAAIGSLSKLQVLSLTGSSIVRLPCEVGKLTRLQILDLSSCRRLEVIPPGVLSCLSRLEELYMENSFVQWEGEDHNGERKYASLAELKLLPNLVTLYLHIVNTQIMPHDLFSENLERFRIFVGDEWDWSGKYETWRTLKVKLNTRIELEKVKPLLITSEDLYLDELKCANTVLYDLEEQGFPQLKHLHVHNSAVIQYVVDSGCMRVAYHSIAFPRLESLFLDNLDNLEKICYGQLMVGSFSNLRKVTVSNCNALKSLFSFSMFKGLRQLKEIRVDSSKMIQDIIAEESEEDDVKDEVIEQTQLRSLTLEYLPQFKRFCSLVKLPSSISHKMQELPTVGRSTSYTEITSNTSGLLFSKMIQFPNLEDLNLTSVNLEKLWPDQITELSPYVKNLTTLIIDGCGNLSYLFAYSIIDCFAQLKKLEIRYCKSLQEVIVTEGEDLLFPKLDTLKLKGLPKLVRFCTGNLIQCPSLKMLSIENCPCLQSFVSSPSDIGTSSSGAVEVSSALFDEKVLFPMMEELKIANMRKLKMIWHDELRADSFCRLTLLEIYQGEELLKVFPSKLLLRFQNLEGLFVKNCNSLEEVFDLQALIKEKETAAWQLRSLFIQILPNLKNVWNGDPRGILSFHSLNFVYVYGCPSLKNLFPFSVAQSLRQLEVLNMYRCGVEDLVPREEGIQGTPKFIFPRLKTIMLWGSENLKSFYSGNHILECTRLENLKVYCCDKLHIFSSESQDLEGTDMENRPPLFLSTKNIPKLMELAINRDLTMIKQAQFPTYLFHKIKTLHLQCFYDASANFIVEVLQKFRNLEKIILRECYCNELLPKGVDFEDAEATIPMIQHLDLNYVPNLRHLWNQNCQLGQVIQNLETVEIIGGPSLTSLAPSSASFRNLKLLTLWDCEGLVKIMSPFTAKSLVNLTIMTVRECKMVTGIIANDADEPHGEIVFGKLETLVLHCLESLRCFCSVSCTIKFPSLEDVVVSQCPKMKYFSEGGVSAFKLKRVHLTVERDRWRWIGDINTTVKHLYTVMVGLSGLQNLRLSEFPRLKELWHDQFPVDFFHDLSRLVVDECASFTAVPCNLLPLFNGLQKLEVSNCDLVDEIFGQVLPSIDGHSGLLSKLNMLTLIDLPSLTRIWIEVPNGILDFKNLTILKIHNCSSLTNILTPTICSGLLQLNQIEVKGCPLVKEIITQGIAAEEVTWDHKITFPLLYSIALESLPKLINFSAGDAIVQWPSLEKISVVDCPTAFASSFVRELESNATDKPKNFSFNLKDLKLSSVDIEKIWNTSQLEMSFCIHNLRSLTVDGCDNLKYLLSSSMVKSIVHLQQLEIRDCKIMEEVIIIEGMEGERISEVAVQDLPKFTKFCNSNLIICPVLKDLKIKNCPRLGRFVSSTASSSLAISTSSAEYETMNSTLFDKKVACPNLQKIEILKMNNLKMIWGNQLHPDSFCKLKEITVEDGKELVKLFPTSMLGSGRLQNLEVLVVKKCSLVEEVFDVQEELVANDATTARASELKTLTIDNLPNLKRIWSKDPLGNLSFPNLCEVYTSNCSSLKSVFPSSIAQGLPNLEVLSIDNCGVDNIVAEKEGVEATPKFVFPRLKAFGLWKLANLKSFYPGVHILESPILEALKVFDCHNLKTFAAAAAVQAQPQNLNVPTGQGQLESQLQPLFSFEKVIPNLEVLTLRSKDITTIQLQGPFYMLKELELQCFHGKKLYSSLDILSKFPNVETFAINSCDFEELFSDELVIEEKHARSLARIRTLRLRRFPYLTLICNKKSQLEQVLQHIEDLDVYLCHSLISLVPSSVSFSNLTKLKVWECDGLVKLVTPRTAKSMVHLAEMVIEHNKMLREIISNEEDEAHSEITLNKLKSLTFNCLTSLSIFSSATGTIKFPSLEEVILIQCLEMKVFSREFVSAPKLRKVYLTEEKDKWRWTKDLNTTLQQLYTETNPASKEE